MKNVKNLINLSLNLTASLSSKDRYRELLKIIKEVIPYDASVLMLVDGDKLIPLESYGLAAEARERVYYLKENPRL